ncbi:hypothetical protein BDV24DRAFT_161118 [Aspergillus arachidicola]|uniref:Uncharacterized protein n=1 Tax=Aspergillus arachidicola TaxID=656916 RepID=A0A5N6YED2_9EURO|nr:hypothetical protein BDV24DRAFT_161118 [Aspergillus arachidicola]
MFDDFSSAVKEVDNFVYEVECREEEEEDLLGSFNLQPVSMDKDAYHHSMTSILPDRSLPILKQKLSPTLIGYIMNLTRHQRSKFDHREAMLAFVKSFEAYVEDKVLPNFDDFDTVWPRGRVQCTVLHSAIYIIISNPVSLTCLLVYWKHGLEREEIEEGEDSDN